mgnify:FL=1
MEGGRLPRRLTIRWLKRMYAENRLSPEAVVRELVKRAEADADNPVWIAPPSLETVMPWVERLDRLDRRTAPL